MKSAKLINIELKNNIMNSRHNLDLQYKLNLPYT